MWNEEFIFRVKPNEHKLVFQVFDENRLTRDGFLGMVELTLINLPREQAGRTIPNKSYPLRPKKISGMLRSKIRGTLEIYHAVMRDQDAAGQNAWSASSADQPSNATVRTTSVLEMPLSPHHLAVSDARRPSRLTGRGHRPQRWAAAGLGGAPGRDRAHVLREPCGANDAVGAADGVAGPAGGVERHGALERGLPAEVPH